MGEEEKERRRGDVRRREEGRRRGGGRERGIKKGKRLEEGTYNQTDISYKGYKQMVFQVMLTSRGLHFEVIDFLCPLEYCCSSVQLMRLKSRGEEREE